MMYLTRSRHLAVAAVTLALGATACVDGPAPESAPPLTPAATSAPTEPDTTSTEAGPVPAVSEAPGPTLELPEDAIALLDGLDDSGFNGIVAIDLDGATTTRAYGVADRDAGIDVDANTVFDVGSITKQFTGAAILRLEMDGKLSVEDPLSDHLDALPDNLAELTLHQLLTHTTGLPGAIGADEEEIPLDQLLTRLADTPLAFAPGTEFEYSNVGYSLLAAVIEAVTGDSYEVYLHDALFEPAGMAHTGYVIPAWDDSEVAVGYDSQSNDMYGRPYDVPWAVDGPYWNLRGNGGVLSTAGDMLLWDRALRGEEILDATAKEKLYGHHVQEGPGAPSFYGYGWSVVPTPSGSNLITHNGGNGIFFADFLRFLDGDLTVFVATNSADEEHEGIAWELSEVVLGESLVSKLEANVDEAADRCGFDGLSLDSLPATTEVETLPDNDAGRTALLFIDILANGALADFEQFAADHVSAELRGDDPQQLADAMSGLQVEFEGFEPAQFLTEDDRTFHVVMRKPTGDVLLSLGFVETEPDRLACVAISS